MLLYSLCTSCGSSHKLDVHIHMQTGGHSLEIVYTISILCCHSWASVFWHATLWILEMRGALAGLSLDVCCSICSQCRSGQSFRWWYSKEDQTTRWTLIVVKLLHILINSVFTFHYSSCVALCFAIDILTWVVCNILQLSRLTTVNILNPPQCLLAEVVKSILPKIEWTTTCRDALTYTACETSYSYVEPPWADTPRSGHTP